ncbi:MAG: acyl-protein synthetase [Armatimonadetes bacterium]|nr:acyl-protein synthetase [Armatimonadota bacterium]
MTSSPTEILVDASRAFSHDPTQDMKFLQAMQEAFTHHFTSCPGYGSLCRMADFSPESLTSYEDMARIPFVFVNVFKERKLISVPEKEIALTLTSSGTGGRKSAIYLDEVTLSRIRRIVYHIYDSYGMYAPSEEANCLAFTYDPEGAGDSGSAWSDRLLSGLTRVREMAYAIHRNTEGNFHFNPEECFSATSNFASSGLPLRILGFPSFLYDFLLFCEEKGRRFSFGGGSFVLTGGGWKSSQNREIPRETFRALAASILGIPPTNVRDLYGLVEHGVPYGDCEYGAMHVPIYSRVYVRDPGTLDLLPDGEPGLLHLVTPYLHSFPAISLLTSDLGLVRKDCPCGRKAPVLELCGRGGLVKHKGCAVEAIELTRGGGR